MSMITELVKRLKDLYVDPELDMLCGVDGECRQAIKESAQVIEELSAKLQATNMERSSQYYNGGWIPVSERLPEENGFYLVTCDGEICGENEPFTGLAEWVDDEEDYQCVLAWMPLPQPYKAESEDKECKK